MLPVGVAFRGMMASAVETIGRGDLFAWVLVHRAN